MYLTREQIESTSELTSRQAAKVLGVGSKSTVNKYRNLYKQYGDTELPENAKILILDIESKPHTAYTWGLWNQNISLSQLVEPGGMICFAAKWLGTEGVIFASEQSHGIENMVTEIWHLLDEAAIVVTYNGDRYDIKRINNEFLTHGRTPPRPYKSIDLYKTNKTRFDLPSKKLDYIAGVTNVGHKMKHQGFDLWVACMEGDAEAWKKMQEYNEQDVLLTERLYIKLLPWLTNIPHMGMFTGDGDTCPYCGHNVWTVSESTYKTQVREYPMWQCANCSGWSRGNKPINNKQETRVAR